MICKACGWMDLSMCKRMYSPRNGLEGDLPTVSFRMGMTFSMKQRVSMYIRMAFSTANSCLLMWAIHFLWLLNWSQNFVNSSVSTYERPFGGIFQDILFCRCFSSNLAYYLLFHSIRALCIGTCTWLERTNAVMHFIRRMCLCSVRYRGS